MKVPDRLLILAAVLVAHPVTLHAVAPKSAVQAQPNIVLIYGDDVGYGDVGCNGATAVKTPHIDRLAREGLRFTSGYSSSATCTPSRYSMLTGEYAFRQKGTGILPGDAALIIPTDRATLPSILKKAGYATGVVGKWHLGLGAGKELVDWNGEDMADTFTRQGVAFIERHKDQPFFLYFATHDIHVPRVPHPRFVGQTLDPTDAPDSCNVLPALLGESPTGRDHVLEHAGRVAIREGQWKFIPGTEGREGNPAAAQRGPQGGVALYNLAQDPAESENVANHHPALADQLSRKLEQLRERGRSRP